MLTKEEIIKMWIGIKLTYRFDIPPKEVCLLYQQALKKLNEEDKHTLLPKFLTLK